MPSRVTVHRMKITLRGIRPPIWRRIEVSSNVTMFQLSAILEAAMGWHGGHLHAFEADGITYQLPSEMDGFSRYETIDERKATLATVLPVVGARMKFEYDFGDGWTHDVIVEAIGPADAALTYPRCLTGKRACPPEDCGGPWGLPTCSRRWPIPTIPNTTTCSNGAPGRSTPMNSTRRTRERPCGTPGLGIHERNC
jgi:hypothetical protein